MKIIGINGSPRLKGNTAQLLDQVLEHAGTNGAETIRYDLNRLDIKDARAATNVRTRTMRAGAF